MAGSAQYTVILDANVLYPNVLRDKLVNQSVPDCLVDNYEALMDSLTLPDPDDRHVLAAAVAGHADAIVTVNLKDFPASVLSRFGLEAQHPDDFIMNQLELLPFEALSVIKQVRARMKNPPRSVDELIAMIEKNGLPQTAKYLRTRADFL